MVDTHDRGGWLGASLLTFLVAAFAAAPALASSVIEEVLSGVGGDPAIQYVEIRMRLAGESAVQGSRLTAFACDGSAPAVLLQVPADVANGSAGARWIMASPDAARFLAAAGVSPDFAWDAAVSGGIPPTCGQVCWGFPGDPSDATDAGWMDCVAYGAYTGPRPAGAGAPAQAIPGGDPFAMRRIGDVAHDNQFAQDCPSPTNNGASQGNFGPCPPMLTTPSRCAAGKLRAATVLARRHARCNAAAIQRDVPLNGACLDKAAIRFMNSVASSDARGDCLPGQGDAAALRGVVDAFIADLGAALVPGGGPSRCTSKKLVAAGALAQKAGQCHAAGAEHGQPPDVGCIGTARGRLIGTFVQAEGFGDCQAANGDAAAVTTRVETLLDELRQELALVGCKVETQYLACAGGEAALRAAVAAATACAAASPVADCAQPTAFRRTIRWSDAPCTIDVINTAASAGGVAICSDESDPVFRQAICLADAAHHVTIDGAGVTFHYADTSLPAPCDDDCNSCGPALFVLKGRCNTVRGFAMEFFPEGVHIREGEENTVDAIESGFYCDDAVTVDSDSGAGSAPTAARISDCTFTGNTPHARCGGAHTGTCGSDKAIQLNGGTSTVLRNTFVDAGQPVHVAGGMHVIQENAASGSTTDQNVCQGFTVSRGTASFAFNTIDYCKFGIRLVGGATQTPIVDAYCNAITNGWVSAFQVKRNRVDDVGPAYLRAERNMLRRHGHQSDGDCQKAALVVKDNPSAEVDFGGGAAGGGPLPPFTASSAGANRFCAQASRPDIWNVDACSGFTGDAAVRAEGNCFDPGPADVAPAGTATDATPSATCTPAECADFGFGGCVLP